MLASDATTRDGIWMEQFKLVHIIELYESLTPNEWLTLYNIAYASLALGGWIAEVQPSPFLTGLFLSNIISQKMEIPSELTFCVCGSSLILHNSAAQ